MNLPYPPIMARGASRDAAVRRRLEGHTSHNEQLNEYRLKPGFSGFRRKDVRMLLNGDSAEARMRHRAHISISTARRIRQADARRATYVRAHVRLEVAPAWARFQVSHMNSLKESWNFAAAASSVSCSMRRERSSTKSLALLAPGRPRVWWWARREG